jgi:hypothetical protein
LPVSYCECWISRARLCQREINSRGDCGMVMHKVLQFSLIDTYLMVKN